MFLFKIKVLFHYHLIKNLMYWILIKKETTSYINPALALMPIRIGNSNANTPVANIDTIRMKKHFSWKKLMILDK